MCCLCVFGFADVDGRLRVWIEAELMWMFGLSLLFVGEKVEFAEECTTDAPPDLYLVQPAPTL